MLFQVLTHSQKSAFKPQSLHTFLNKAKGKEVSLSVNTLSLFHKGKRLTKTTFSMQQCTRKKCRRSVKQPQESLQERGFDKGPYLEGLFKKCQTISKHGEEITRTGDVSSTVSVLFLDVALSAAAVMGAHPVLTQLVTDSPHRTVIKVLKQMRIKH